MTRVLVTGGAGFIGSNLVRALLERGDDVRVLDNFSTGSRANLAGLGREVEIVEGELRSYERVHNAVRGSEVVFHLGALGSVPRSVQDPLTSTAVNVEGTLNVLLAARDEGIRRVVAASSSSVYGDGGTFPRVETQPPDPISPYAVAKLAAERFCVSFTRVYGFETVALRYFNVFGPRQDPSSQYAAVVPLFIRAIADGQPGHDPRRRRAVARLHLRRERRRGEPPRRRRSRRGRAGAQRRRRARRRPSTPSRTRSGACSGCRSRRRTDRRRPATYATRGPTCPPRREALGYEPAVGFEEGLRRTIEAMLGTEGAAR